MSTKYTPAPWKFSHREGADGQYRTEVFSEEHGGIATCDWTPKHCGNGVTKTYREANARLIAAAPDLLEACIYLAEGLEACGLTGVYLDQARAAIAKATEATA